MSLKVTTFTAIAGILMCAQSPAVDADALRLAQTSGTEKAPAASDKPLGRSEGRAVTVKGTIAAIDKEKSTVTLKGPKGRTETVEAKDPKNLDLVKVGDLVEISYMQALAVSLDKPAKK